MWQTLRKNEVLKSLGTNEKEGLSDVGIFVWDHNKEEGYQRFKDVVADEATSKYVKGERDWKLCIL